MEDFEGRYVSDENIKFAKLIDEGFLISEEQMKLFINRGGSSLNLIGNISEETLKEIKVRVNNIIIQWQEKGCRIDSDEVPNTDYLNAIIQGYKMDIPVSAEYLDSILEGYKK